MRGFCSGEQDVVDNWADDTRWEPSIDSAERGRQFRLLKTAGTKYSHWIDEDVKQRQAHPMDPLRPIVGDLQDVDDRTQALP